MTKDRCGGRSHWSIRKTPLTAAWSNSNLHTEKSVGKDLSRFVSCKETPNRPLRFRLARPKQPTKIGSPSGEKREVDLSYSLELSLSNGKGVKRLSRGGLPFGRVSTRRLGRFLMDSQDKPGGHHVDENSSDVFISWQPAQSWQPPLISSARVLP